MASGVLKKVDEPTDWVSNLVVVEKKEGSLRLCLDPKNLNKAIKREHHAIPTMQDIAELKITVGHRPISSTSGLKVLVQSELVTSEIILMLISTFMLWK